MFVKKARAVSMRSAHAALLLTTALAWGVSAQAVGSLRGLGGRGAEGGDSSSLRMVQDPTERAGNAPLRVPPSQR